MITSSFFAFRLPLTQKLEKDPFASNAGSTLGQESLELARTVARKGPGGMDEVDHHGNTPLLLALQLGRLECANVRFSGVCT